MPPRPPSSKGSKFVSFRITMRFYLLITTAHVYVGTTLGAPVRSYIYSGSLRYRFHMGVTNIHNSLIIDMDHEQLANWKAPGPPVSIGAVDSHDSKLRPYMRYRRVFLVLCVKVLLENRQLE
ncbi:uncharacterized protein LAJ45_09658 [Morchella importuna]|uniref:uncharacterized protein n=1 Tax=Morchella importuna TaxID=1174673 RepID=UPI001E8CBF0D|nr:uncharacterized protein LAJ45_09658 [Morchella importuna]KAH8146216.1 hypothetical protein LAJ45_09658 [Morchella importuna]